MISYFGYVDGKIATGTSSAAASNAVIQNGKRHLSLVKVRKNSVTAYFDGKLVGEFHGDPKRLTTDPAWDIGKNMIGIGSSKSPILFQSLELNTFKASATSPAATK